MELIATVEASVREMMTSTRLALPGSSCADGGASDNCGIRMATAGAVLIVPRMTLTLVVTALPTAMVPSWWYL